MKVFDLFTFAGEYDLLEIRFNILKDYVDKFIVVEFDKTFSGKNKQPLFPQRFKNLDNVSWYVYTENHYEQYRKLAENSPNTKGASHWVTEFTLEVIEEKADLKRTGYNQLG